MASDSIGFREVVVGECYRTKHELLEVVEAGPFDSWPPMDSIYRIKARYKARDRQGERIYQASNKGFSRVWIFGGIKITKEEFEKGF